MAMRPAVNAKQNADHFANAGKMVESCRSVFTVESRKSQDATRNSTNVTFELSGATVRQSILNRVNIRAFCLVTALMCIMVPIANCAEWSWRFREDPDSLRRTRAELDSLLKQDRGLKSARDSVVAKIFVFDNAILDSVVLAGVDLSYLAFENSSLRGARMSTSRMMQTSFRTSDLTGANLSEAELYCTDFTGCKLDSSNLAGITASHSQYLITQFSKGNKTETEVPLPSTSLRGASLLGANLSRADLFDVELSGAIFEIDSLPNVETMAFARGLDSLRYRVRPNGLVALQGRFHELGLAKAERKVICSIRRCSQTWWEYLLFDYTCEWGSNLWRPWRIVGLLWFLASCIYFVSTLLKGPGGLYLIESGYGQKWSSRRPRTNAVPTAIPLRTTEGKLKAVWPNSFSNWPMPVRMIWWSLFFSAMSAFNIGFREVNFGRWIRLLTRREIDLIARGWVRPVAGIQSILSVGLVILWFLSLTGTPFKSY